MLTPEDTALIEEFRRAVDGLSPEKAAESVSGVSAATVRRYMDGEMPSRLTTEVRLALRGFLKDRATGRSEEENGGAQEATRAPHAPERWDDPFLEVLVRESRAADKRAEAAVNWSRWLERAESAGEMRTRLAQRLNPAAAESARAEVEPAVAPGVGRQMLRQFLEELLAAETPARKVSGDPHT